MAPIWSTMDVDMPNYPQSDADYLVYRAKNALKTDRNEAKAWMLTAQTLFPHNFGVQFEAYNIEKAARNLKEAAKCFASLFQNFPEEKELWNEIIKFTVVLRDTDNNNEEVNENNITEAELMKQIFNSVSVSIQHSLLLNCAERTHDSMEHCKLMLLLFNKFPAAVLNHGCTLMENLITVEKHSHVQHTPINSFRKLLVCDLLPLLGASKLDLQPRNLLRLLYKAIEFYVTYLFDPLSHQKKDDAELIKIDEPWTKLWEIVVNLGTKLGWDLCITFNNYWNKEVYWSAMLLFYQSRTQFDDVNCKQLVYCCLLVMLRCVHEYLTVVDPASENGYLLVEAFCSPPPATEPLTKRCKLDEDITTPVVTPDGSVTPNVVNSFITAIKCLDLMRRNEILDKELTKLYVHLRFEVWLKNFFVDMYLYKQQYDNSILYCKNNLSDTSTRSVIVNNLLLTSSFFFSQNCSSVIDTIRNITVLLPNLSGHVGSLNNQLSLVTRNPRHLHFLPLHKLNILHYCVKILIALLKQKKNDFAYGHLLVLMQLDWPAEEELLLEVTNTIRMRGGFSYPLFTQYVINVDILEQFAFLASEQGSKVPLDILPTSPHIQSQRRMSTRGVDKGAKEDFKLAIRRQVARSNEPIDVLIINFITSEFDLIHHSVMST